MAGDAASFEQLQAELRQLEELYTASRAEVATLRAENVTLAAERSEAREQQASTAEILRVIASSPTDLQLVLDAIAEAAARACRTNNAFIRLVDGDHFLSAAAFGPSRVSLGERVPIDGDTPSGRVILTRKTWAVEDMLALPEDEFP